MKSRAATPLRRGDGIALVNPAGVLPARFAKQHAYIKEYLHQLGFRVKDFVVTQDWEEPRRRCDTLMRAFLDPDIAAVLPICGGGRVFDILPHLDYATLANHPKIICGSSDLSALVIALSEKADMVTFFGPHLNFLNPKASKPENRFTVRSFWNMLRWDWHGKKRFGNQ